MDDDSHPQRRQQVVGQTITAPTSTNRNCELSIWLPEHIFFMSLTRPYVPWYHSCAPTLPTTCPSTLLTAPASLCTCMPVCVFTINTSTPRTRTRRRSSASGVLVHHYHADNHHSNDYNQTLRDVTATITNFSAPRTPRRCLTHFSVAIHPCVLPSANNIITTTSCFRSVV